MTDSIMSKLFLLKVKLNLVCSLNRTRIRDRIYVKTCKLTLKNSPSAGLTPDNRSINLARWAISATLISRRKPRR
jgi:hypothetical protein